MVHWHPCHLVWTVDRDKREVDSGNAGVRPLSVSVPHIRRIIRFILMSQTRATKQADARSHLDLQINLLAEQESTKMLQMLRSLCEFHKLGIARDEEIEALIQPTQPKELLKDLQDKLPADN